MKTYLIERDIPGAGSFSAEQKSGIVTKSCNVIGEMGEGIEWVKSYLAGDKVYCVYRATDEDSLYLHGKKAGFPITRIFSVDDTIRPIG